MEEEQEHGLVCLCEHKGEGEERNEYSLFYKSLRANSSGNWVPLPTVPFVEQSYAFAMVAFQGKVFVFSMHNTEMYMLDLKESPWHWIRRADLLSGPTTDPHFVVMGNKIYVLETVIYKQGPVVYDTEENVWEILPMEGLEIDFFQSAYDINGTLFARGLIEDFSMFDEGEKRWKNAENKLMKAPFNIRAFDVRTKYAFGDFLIHEYDYETGSILLSFKPVFRDGEDPEIEYIEPTDFFVVDKSVAYVLQRSNLLWRGELREDIVDWQMLDVPQDADRLCYA